MSVELDIFPTSQTFPTWGEIKVHWRTVLSDQTHLVEKLSLRVMGSDVLIQDNDRLTPENSYYLEMSNPNTLGVVVSKGEDIDKGEYIEDYGHNLTPEQIKDYVDRWNTAGYYFEITSQAGRSDQESKLMIALATALANSCDGYIIVMNPSIFDLGVGVYTPDEFAKTRPKF